VNASTVKVTIAFTDPDLDAEEQDEEAQRLFNQLRELDEVETVDRVLDPNPPEGNKAFGGFLPGRVATEVKPDQVKPLFGFFRGRPMRSSFEMKMEANGKKLEIKVNNQEDLQTAMQLAQQFLASQESAPAIAFNPSPVGSSTVVPISPVEVFFSYSHQDEDLRNELAIHLAMLKREGMISAWHDREITAGTERATEIDTHLNSAQIILLLVSANFLASDYCFDIEMQRAMERHAIGEARVIPIILKPCDWAGAPFSQLQALPKNALPITKWSDRDEAFLNVAQGIRSAIQQMAIAKK
jgi:hypothetical protein